MIRSLFKGVCALALGSGAWNLCAVELPSDWKNVQTVTLNQSGLIKFSVPLDTLTAARAGLEDLRLYDETGREVPYVLEQPVEPRPVTRPAGNLQVMLSAEATVVTLETGFAQAVSGLTLQTPAPDFLKAVRIEGAQDRATWVTLGRGQPVFRQPNGASRLHLAVAPRAWRFLRLTLDDRGSKPIPVTGVEVHAEAGQPAPSEPFAVRVTQREEEPGRTRLALRFEGANVTLAGLTVETPEPLFTRPATLLEQQFVGNEVRESLIAQHSLYRVALADQPVNSNLTFAVDVPVRSRELALVIQNDDNLPLQLTAVRAFRRPVYLTFLAGSAGTYHLLTGNAQCPAPRYDLTALKGNLQNATLVSVAAALLSANAAYRPADPLADIQALGTPLDVSDWRFRKRVQFAADGVQQIDLDLELLAHANRTLGDLRLIRDSRQVPYVLERTSLNRGFAPTLTQADDPKRPTTSRWQIALPHAGLPLSRLTCTSSAPYFRREARLYEERRDGRGTAFPFTLASATWVRTLGRSEGALTLSFQSPPATDKLMLEVENGDNPPLDLKRLEAWYPVTRLLCKSPADAETLLYYGNPKADTPRYDLELVVPKLLVAQRIQATLSSQETLKPGAAREGWASAGWMFWAVLGLVVVALLGVIARLLPKPKAEG